MSDESVHLVAMYSFSPQLVQGTHPVSCVLLPEKICNTSRSMIRVNSYSSSYQCVSVESTATSLTEPHIQFRRAHDTEANRR